MTTVSPLPGHWAGGTPDGVSELVAASTAKDGIAPLSGHVLAALHGGRAEFLAVRVSPGRRGDELIAIAAALGSDPAELVVAPAHRRRGIGTALTRAAIARQGAVWAYGDLPAAAAVAARLQLERGRQLLQLRRTLDDLPADAVLPPGVRIRTFQPDRDEQQVLEVNARAFDWHPEQGALDLAGLRDQMAEPWFDSAGFFVAVRDGDGPDQVVGFHWTKVHGTDPTPRGGPARPIGEVYVLAADPAAGIRGLGGPLTSAGLRYLAGRGLSTVMLYTESDNERALRTYGRLGFETYLSNVVYRLAPEPNARPGAAR